MSTASQRKSTKVWKVADPKPAWPTLAKAIGPGRQPSAKEIRRRWQGWKDGKYDPTTGVWL